MERGHRDARLEAAVLEGACTRRGGPGQRVLETGLVGVRAQMGAARQRARDAI